MKRDRRGQPHPWRARPGTSRSGPVWPEHALMDGERIVYTDGGPHVLPEGDETILVPESVLRAYRESHGQQKEPRHG